MEVGELKRLSDKKNPALQQWLVTSHRQTNQNPPCRKISLRTECEICFISEASCTIRFFPKEETSLLRQLVFLHPGKGRKKKLWKGNRAISQLCLLTPPSLFPAQWLLAASTNTGTATETHKNETPENEPEICNASYSLKIFSLFSSPT